MRALVAETYAGWRRHLDLQLAAALAFFSSLALPPLAALTLAGAEAIFGRDAVRDFAYQRLEASAGTEVARLLSGAVETYIAGRSGLPTVLAVVGLFFAATGLLYQAQLSLGHVFEFARPSDFKSTVRLRGLGLAGIVVAAVLVVALFGVLSLLSAIQVLSPAVSALTTAAIAATALAAAVFSYRWLSGRTVPWSAALAGGLFTTVSLLVGRSLLSAYLGVVGVGSAYGSVASVFVLLMWLYAIGVVFLVGGEVARAWMTLAERSAVD
jgi:membrane protein